VPQNAVWVPYRCKRQAIKKIAIANKEICGNSAATIWAPVKDFDALLPAPVERVEGHRGRKSASRQHAVRQSIQWLLVLSLLVF
jgi:hypothetical protein